MDLGTLIGIVLGFVLIIGSILLGGSLGAFIDIPSIMIVVGGTIAATLVAYPLPKVKEIIKLTQKVFKERGSNPNEVIESMIELANKARKEGLLALEESSAGIDDDFIKKGVMLVVDGTDPDLVRTLLETELDFLDERHKSGQGLFETMGSFAPAFGMVGTLIGLINMLKKLDDPSSIGPAMSVALLTTFYGSFLANMIFIPIANKLKVKSREETLEREIIVEGLLSIQAGENPRIIEEKLKAFLPPSMRKQLQEGEA
ncbi:flagellar motor protein [Tepidibacter hydrothermalis]|uniref:Flagellar motor protein n=1 Tax=Tepidibacter hydrothermalis TaxID=3036126 RepID=A0ABY8EKM4_9FIRM|nr:flagellar motor protein [Tepidibacter hydrothermalis]WFD11683.1 flagellar motor protein [Tepidibacter hydrothermalis]